MKSRADLFDAVVELPDVGVQRRYDALVGLDDVKGDSPRKRSFC